MQPEKGNYCLATYRGQDANNRVEIRMRVVEGHYGTVQVRRDSDKSAESVELLKIFS